MLETWSPLEIVGGLCTLGAVFCPPLYAWCDRWIDRTRNKISDVVSTANKAGN